MPIGQNVLQGLLQRGKDQRSEKKRKDRINRVTGLFGIVHGQGTPEEKQKAAGELAALGVPVSQKLLQPDVDATDLFNILNIDEEFIAPLNAQINAGNMTLSQALNFAAQSGDSVERLTDENINKLFDAGYFQGENFKGSVIQTFTSADQIIAHIGFTSAVTKNLGVEGAGRLLSPGRQGKLTTIQEKTNVFIKYAGTEAGTLKPIEELLADPGSMAALWAAGYTRKEILGIYNVNPAAIVAAEKSLMAEIMSGNILFQQGLPGQALPDYIEAYTEGREDAFVGDSKLKALGMETVKKFYDRTGEMKTELVREESDRIMQLAIENSNSVGGLQAGDIPLKFQGYMKIIMEIEESSGKRVTKSMVRKWMREDSKRQGYNLTPLEESQFLLFFEE